MRKYGERPDNGDVQLVSDVRRGRPELEDPGLAEAEKLAGANIFARGGGATRADTSKLMQRLTGTETGGAVSPETIAQHKLQLQRLVADQFSIGNMDLRRINRWAQDKGWRNEIDRILDIDPTGEGKFVRTFVFGKREALVGGLTTYANKVADRLEAEGATDTAQSLRQQSHEIQADMDRAPGKTYSSKLMWAIQQQYNKAKSSEGVFTTIPMRDPSGQLHEIPINMEE
jgi:hypothetical protein